MTEKAGDGSGSLSFFPDSHGRGMAKSMAMNHVGMETGQLGVFLDDRVQVVARETAEEQTGTSALREPDQWGKVSDGVPRGITWPVA